MKPRAPALISLALLSACAHAAAPRPSPAHPVVSSATPAAAPALVAADGFVPFACTVEGADPDGDRVRAARGALLHFARPVQYAVLRGVWWEQADDGSATGEPSRIVTYAQVGAYPEPDLQLLYRDAMMSSETKLLLQASRSAAKRALGLLYFVVIEGPAIHVLATPEELHALLGPVDSPGDAAFWLMQSLGTPIGACGDLEQNAYRLVEDGIEVRVHLFTHACRPLTEAMLVYHVARDGSVREQSRSIISDEPEGCVVD